MLPLEALGETVSFPVQLLVAGGIPWLLVTSLQSLSL